MSTWEIALYVILIGSALFQFLLEGLNLRAARSEVPEEFRELYDPTHYERSQAYLRAHTGLELIQQGVVTLGLVSLIASGAFGFWDAWVRTWGLGSLGSGLLFFAGLFALGRLVALPFQLISTFGIESRYGFNRTTPSTFVGDLLKGLGLGAVLGGGLLAGMLWFFETSGPHAWWIVWVLVFGFQVIVMALAPTLILPIFNKFDPIPKGDLKERIFALSEKLGFAVSGLYRMDGSKRSSKANAFFTGLGRTKRIVLFDTLIEKQTTEEILAVLAHEIGHYQMRHLFRQLSVGLVSSGVLFFLMGQMLDTPAMIEAFGIKEVSVYASLACFSFFFAPLSRVISLWSLWLSRRYEFEADAYAVQKTGMRDELISSLKKLSVDSLSNLTPHPWKVFFEYTHPPVIKRVQAMRQLPQSGSISL
jgi:STE24 endopeptidase